MTIQSKLSKKNLIWIVRIYRSGCLFLCSATWLVKMMLIPQETKDNVKKQTHKNRLMRRGTTFPETRTIVYFVMRWVFPDIVYKMCGAELQNDSIARNCISFCKRSNEMKTMQFVWSNFSERNVCNLDLSWWWMPFLEMKITFELVENFCFICPYSGIFIAHDKRLPALSFPVWLKRAFAFLIHFSFHVVNVGNAHFTQWQRFHRIH